MSLRIECDSGVPTARDVCMFLSDYSSRLLSSGATCIRIDKNVNRIARAYCMEAQMAVMPRHIHMTVIDHRNGEILTSIATVADTGINFTINSRLSSLSWEIADRKVGFNEAIRNYNDIIRGKKQNKWLLLLLVSIANASFCRLFNGDAVAMAVVAVATFAGFYMKQFLARKRVDTRLIFIICAFISSVIGATDMIFSIGTTPMTAIGTSVLYLVPGIPFLNSFSDILYRHYICGFGRFCDAVVLTSCLSIGLCAGMILMKIGMF